MTTYIRDFGCHDYRMQTEVDLSTNAKRLIRIGDDGANGRDGIRNATDRTADHLIPPPREHHPMPIAIRRRATGEIIRTVDANTLADADLTGANMYGANLSGANLTRANLTGAKLSGAELSGADMYAANLSGANLTRADLPRADMRDADLIRADLTGANLTGADLTRADLYGANLTGANLTGADLYGADLTRADLYGANLTGANLTGANLHAARGVIDAGADARGFRFWCWRHPDGHPIYRASCREWTAYGDAWRHYGPAYASNGDPQECRARLLVLLLAARSAGWTTEQPIT